MSDWFTCKECGQPFPRMEGSREVICEACQDEIAQAEEEENETEWED